MKTADAKTLATLAAGQAKRLDLYEITLAGGAQTYYFTTGQVPTPYNGRTYQTGLLFQRGSFTQTVGMTVDSMQVTVTPQTDALNGLVFIAGYSFLQACAFRILDGARILFRKFFLDDWNTIDRNPVAFFQGRVNTLTVDRFSAQITINSDIEMLNVQSPVNVLQPGCLHTLFDPGCALSPNAFQVGGTVATGSDQINVLSNLTQADDWFSLGRITFTSGKNVGISRTVKQYGNTGGKLTLPYPLPFAPSSGDTFLVFPGCDKTQATCKAKFNNLKRFRGYPYVPVPETLYDGGTVQTSRNDAGSQGGSKAGSIFGAQRP